MAGELFEMMAGVGFVHVPYRGSAPALADLLGGQVQVMFVSPLGLIEYYPGRQAARAGGTTATRSKVPGHPDFGRIRTGLRGYFVVRCRRAHLIVDKLNREINAALDDPQMKARISDMGAPSSTHPTSAAHRR